MNGNGIDVNDCPPLGGMGGPFEGTHVVEPPALLTRTPMAVPFFGQIRLDTPTRGVGILR